MDFTDFDFASAEHIATATMLWNAACGPELSIAGATMHYNTRPNTGGVQAGWVAGVAGRTAGFVLASALPGEPSVMSPDAGWIDALAVTPEMQRTFVGCGLLRRAEAWLRDQGCRYAIPGGSIRPFAAGVPVESRAESFFARCGYVPRPRAVVRGTWPRMSARTFSRYGGASCLGSRGRRCGRATRLPCSPICVASPRSLAVRGGGVPRERRGDHGFRAAVDIRRRRRLLPAHVRGLHPPDGSLLSAAAATLGPARLHRHQRTPLRQGLGRAAARPPGCATCVIAGLPAA